MRKILTILSLLTIPLTAFTQETGTRTEEKPLITQGYFDLKSKMLIIMGPAAVAIWDQMANVEAGQIVDKNGLARKIKDSNGTFCEHRLEQTRTRTTPVLTTVCGIVQKNVGF